jgi:hypothetical protein
LALVGESLHIVMLVTLSAGAHGFREPRSKDPVPAFTIAGKLHIWVPWENATRQPPTFRIFALLSRL